MDLQHRFTVPTGVEETWGHFQDIAALAECFPGATVTEADEESFSGSVKVKLGPIALVYNGSGTFVERDHAGHSFKVDAKGKDKRGNGTAGAKVTLSMSEGSEGSTDVEVLTDLNVTGKPAQFGRGVMQDVSDKLLGQFVACLEDRMAASQPVESAGSAEPAAAAAPADDAASTDPQTAAAAATAAADAPEPAGPTPIADAAASASTQRRTSSSGESEALDLGATVLPVLVKGYWKPALGVLGVLVVLRWLLGRR